MNSLYKMTTKAYFLHFESYIQQLKGICKSVQISFPHPYHAEECMANSLHNMKL